MKPLGFQWFDGSACGYQSLSLLTQLLQTDPNKDLGKFTHDCSDPNYVYTWVLVPNNSLLA